MSSLTNCSILENIYHKSNSQNITFYLTSNTDVTPDKAETLL